MSWLLASVQLEQFVRSRSRARSSSIPISRSTSRIISLTLISLADAYILQRSKLARVTAVARSNYDAVNGEFRCPIEPHDADPSPAKGMHIRSKKYGTHESWKPYRRK